MCQGSDFRRPRPGYISRPLDVQAEPVDEAWEPVPLPARPAPAPSRIAEAAKMLKAAVRPVIMTGGGATAGLNLPVIIRENGGLKQIQDDMDGRGIPRVGVEGINPDFVALATACHCHGAAPRDETELGDAFRDALATDRPTVIVVREGDEWLQ